MACGLSLHCGLFSQPGRGEWVVHREEIPPSRCNRLARSFTAGDAHVTTVAGQLPQRIVAGLAGKIDRVEWIDTCENRGSCQHRESNMLALSPRGCPYGTHLVLRVAVHTVS